MSVITNGDIAVNETLKDRVRKQRGRVSPQKYDEEEEKSAWVAIQLN